MTYVSRPTIGNTAARNRFNPDRPTTYVAVYNDGSHGPERETREQAEADYTERVYLTNPDGITAQEITHRSIEQQVRAMKIEQDCCLIDLSRAARSFAFHRHVAHRWRSLYSTANDEKWREICQASKPVKDMERKEFERAKQASHKAQEYGARQAQCLKQYRDALRTGREDAESMTAAEIRAFIRNAQS